MFCSDISSWVGSRRDWLTRYWPGTEGRPLSRAWPGPGWCVSPAAGWGLRWTAPWSWCPPRWNRNTNLVISVEISYNSTTISRNIIAFVAALKAVKVMICTFPSYRRHHAGGSEVINECLGSWTPHHLSAVGKAHIFFLTWGSRAAKFHDWIGLKLDESNLSLPEPISACSRGCFFTAETGQHSTRLGQILVFSIYCFTIDYDAIFRRPGIEVL